MGIEIRTYGHTEADGSVSTIIMDATWAMVRGHRQTLFEMTDTLMIQFDRLTDAEQEQLKTFRQTLRDITNYDTPNEACDAMPDLPQWVIAKIQ